MQQRNRDIAIAMLREKQDIAFIARVTGLSLQEIMQLRKNID